jgi:hypothetical protein
MHTFSFRNLLYFGQSPPAFPFFLFARSSFSPTVKEVFFRTVNPLYCTTKRPGFVKNFRILHEDPLFLYQFFHFYAQNIIEALRGRDKGARMAFQKPEAARL